MKYFFRTKYGILDQCVNHFYFFHLPKKLNSNYCQSSIERLIECWSILLEKRHIIREPGSYILWSFFVCASLVKVNFALFE